MGILGSWNKRLLAFLLFLKVSHKGCQGFLFRAAAVTVHRTSSCRSFFGCTTLWGRKKRPPPQLTEAELGRAELRVEDNPRIMDQVHVRCVEGESKLKISFFLPNNDACNMERDKVEGVSTCLNRLKSTITKKLEAAAKRGGGVIAGHGRGKAGRQGGGGAPVQFRVSVKLVDKSTQEAIDPVEHTNRSGWQNGRELVISAEPKKSQETDATKGDDDAGGEAATQGAQEGDGVTMIRYDVILNPPAVQELRFAVKLFMVGYPVIAAAQLEYSEGAKYLWFTGHNDTWHEVPEQEDSLGSAIFVPTEQDLGQNIKVLCTPYNQSMWDIRGRTITLVGLSEVVAGPIPGLVALRVPAGEPTLPRTAAPVLRVACYNILADFYASSDFSKKHLYNYVDPKHLSYEYRTLLTLRELHSYNADIIALQEVDERVFKTALQPALSLLGFEGRFRCKCGSTREGEALFVRRSRYTIVASFDADLKDLLAAKNSPFRELLDAYPDQLRRVVQERLTTTVQIALLKACDGPDMLVANTHLFFHPNAQPIRLLQTATIVAEMERIRDRVQAHYGVRPRLMLCGDLNSTPRTATVRFLKGQTITPRDAAWQWLFKFEWGRRGEFFEGGDEGGAEGKDDGEWRGDDEAQHDSVVLVEERDMDAGKPPASTGEAPAVRAIHVEHGDHTEESSLAEVGLEAYGAEQEYEWRPGVDEGQFDAQDEMLRSAQRQCIPTLRLRTPLISTCCPLPFTNFVQGFIETLDYIFVEAEGAKVLSVAAIPSRDVIVQDTALPSWQFPSDHLSIMCDVALLDRDGAS